MSENSAIIFDLQKCSFIDGPGIRTTVFFKGCNLKCRWCHNPESQSFRPELLFNKDRCTGCGTCKRVCPHDLEFCDVCGKCALYCPANARQKAGMVMTVDELMEAILADKDFYESSGGGVTFSGGECLLQPEALKSLLIRCKENAVHTAVDTAGNVPFGVIEDILPYTDLFLYDLKCVTKSLHQEGTGDTNERILENLERLAKIEPEKITVRIPLIPGFNTTDAELTKMADLLRKLKIRRVEPLPYHRMGEWKYQALQRTVTHFEVPDKALIEHCKTLLGV